MGLDQPAHNAAENSTIDPEEVRKFDQAAPDWWNPFGEFKLLHDINPIRLTHIYRMIAEYCPEKPLTTLRALDVACGGGLITEPLAAKGLDITGIDASQTAINVATAHAEARQLTIPYESTSLEAYSADHQKAFDIVLALEIIEHVADVDHFMTCLTQLLKPQGILIISTLNRNLKSYLLAILGAEYILNWVPKGTHQWHHFFKPAEIARHLREFQVEVRDVSGLTYAPLSQTWSMSDDTDVNYILTAQNQG